jgi:hypothetical protein
MDPSRLPATWSASCSRVNQEHAMPRRTVARGTILAAALVFSGAAAAATIHTAAMQPGSDQLLVCTVVNTSGKPLSITALIMDRWGDNTTCFVRTDWDATYTILLTVSAESISPDARYCRVTIKGGRKSDVSASIQACTLDRTACTSPVVAR